MYLYEFHHLTLVFRSYASAANAYLYILYVYIYVYISMYIRCLLVYINIKYIINIYCYMYNERNDNNIITSHRGRRRLTSGLKEMDRISLVET